MKSHMAIDNPIRWKIFNLNRPNKLAGWAIDYCPCGTRGNCMVCASTYEWLYERWLAVLHPFRWLWIKVTRKRFR